MIQRKNKGISRREFLTITTVGAGATLVSMDRMAAAGETLASPHFQLHITHRCLSQPRMACLEPLADQFLLLNLSYPAIQDSPICLKMPNR